MTAIFYWIGVVHVSAYALAGFSFAAALFADWIVDRFKLKRDLIQAAHRMFKERNERRKFASAIKSRQEEKEG